MVTIREIISKIPDLVNIKIDDELQMGQFCIKPLTAANSDEANCINFSFLYEIVEINGKEERVVDIAIRERYSNLQEVENHISQFGYHISSVYEI